MIGLPYTIERYEYVDKKRTRLGLHCIGHDVDGFAPDENTWFMCFIVPNDELDQWPLGATVRVEFNVRP